MKKILLILSASVVLYSCDNKPVESSSYEQALLFNGVELEDDLLSDSEQRNLQRSYVILKKISEDDKKDIYIQLLKERNALLLSKYMEKMSDVSFTNDELKEYYNKNIDEFKDKKLSLSHIFIRGGNDSVEKSAEQVLRLINDGELSFEEAVAQYSDDYTTKLDDGYIGLVDRGSNLYFHLFDEVEHLSKGAVSNVILTSEGAHIVKVIDVINTESLSFESQKDLINYKLKSAYIEEKLSELDSSN